MSENFNTEEIQDNIGINIIKYLGLTVLIIFFGIPLLAIWFCIKATKPGGFFKL